MELTEAVERRRMTRNFSGAALDAGVLDGLLADALRAPSAGNTQGREFVVLEGPTRPAATGRPPPTRRGGPRSRRFEGLSRAPVVVLPFADPDAYRPGTASRTRPGPTAGTVEWVVPFWFVDAAFAVMTLLLGATDRGIGAAFLGNFRGEAALSAPSAFPTRLRWLGAVLLGEPAEPDPLVIGRPPPAGARGRASTGDGGRAADR